MEEVTKILRNPLVRSALGIAAPEVAIGVELIVGVADSLFGSNEPRAQELLAIIDRRLADVLRQLAEVRTKTHRHELEVRAHTMLGILNEWGKIT